MTDEAPIECPRCDALDDSIPHSLGCPNLVIILRRQEAAEAFQRSMTTTYYDDQIALAARTPPPILAPTLVEFMTARLDEEAQEAQAVLDLTAPLAEFGLTYGLVAFIGSGSSTFPSRHWPWDPERVLAEIAAKRAILELHAPWEDSDCCSSCGDVPQTEFPCETILALAQVYADHPEFNPAWKVT